MKTLNFTSSDGFTLYQRIYSSRCKTEIDLTCFLVNWFNTEKNKSLDELEKLIDSHLSGKTRGKIVKIRKARGRYIVAPFEREWEINLGKPGRYPFIQIGEPFVNTKTHYTV